MIVYIARSPCGTDVYRSIPALERDFNIPERHIQELRRSGFTVVEGPDGSTDIKAAEIKLDADVNVSACLQLMEKHGGGFVNALARAYRVADSDNASTLRAGFDHYFKAYGPEGAFAEEYQKILEGCSPAN
jgi:hypothetical protein